MEHELVIQDKRHTALERSEPQFDSPLLTVMDKLANNPNLDADKIERIFNMFLDGQRKMREMDDERAFAEGMAEFKKNPPLIVKNRLAEMMKEGRKLYEYRFADLDAYTSAAMPSLAERGITWSFPFSENSGGITVSCILRYGLYCHTPSTLSSPPDNTGGKNAIQAKSSTISYLERYTFCGATGLTAALPDVDGNGKVKEPMADQMFIEYLEPLENASTLPELQKAFTTAYKAAEKLGDKSGMAQFIKAKDKRKKELNANG